MRIEGRVKAVCKYFHVKLKGDSPVGTSHLNTHYTKKKKKKASQQGSKEFKSKTPSE